MEIKSAMKIISDLNNPVLVENSVAPAALNAIKDAMGAFGKSFGSNLVEHLTGVPPTEEQVEGFIREFYGELRHIDPIPGIEADRQREEQKDSITITSTSNEEIYPISISPTLLAENNEKAQDNLENKG